MEHSLRTNKLLEYDPILLRSPLNRKNPELRRLIARTLKRMSPEEVVQLCLRLLFKEYKEWEWPEMAKPPNLFRTLVCALFGRRVYASRALLAYDRAEYDEMLKTFRVVWQRIEIDVRFLVAEIGEVTS